MKRREKPWIPNRVGDDGERIMLTDLLLNGCWIKSSMTARKVARMRDKTEQNAEQIYGSFIHTIQGVT